MNGETHKLNDLGIAKLRSSFASKLALKWLDNQNYSKKSFNDYTSKFCDLYKLAMTQLNNHSIPNRNDSLDGK